MKPCVIAAMLAVVGLAFATTANAQLALAKDNPIVYGHHHLNVTDVENQKRFWIDTIGGSAASFGNTPVVKFTNVLMFLREQKPTGGTKGTTVNHIGFTVPNLRTLLDNVESAGYSVVTKEEVPASYEVNDGISYNAVQKAYLAFVMAPDNVKIEFIEDTTQTDAAILHHIHHATQNVAEMKAWYVKTFDAVPGMRGNFEAADLPGVNLTYSPSEKPLAGTKGRSLDHIGFEVDGLEAFCKKLETEGVTFDLPYTVLEKSGIAIAFFTDPFGTYIELTEGLDTL